MSEALDDDDFAVDLYEYTTFIGTIVLDDGTFRLSGPEMKKLVRYVDMCRRKYKCQTDTEVFAALPDMYHGTIHLRSVGNVAGTDEEP